MARTTKPRKTNWPNEAEKHEAHVSWRLDPNFALLEELLYAYADLNGTLVAEKRFNKAAKAAFDKFGMKFMEKGHADAVAELLGS